MKYNKDRSLLIKCLCKIKSIIEIIGIKKILPTITNSENINLGKGIENLTDQIEMPLKIFQVNKKEKMCPTIIRKFRIDTLLRNFTFLNMSIEELKQAN